MKRDSFAGIFAVLAAAFLWGTTGTAATFAPSVGPLTMGAAALGIGGILQAAVAIPSLRRERRALASQRGTVLAGAAGVLIYPLAFYSSMHLAGVAVGTVVSLGSAPIASGLLERVLERRPLSRWWMLAAALGIVGSAILCASKMHDAPSETLATVAGVILGLVAGATYAMYSWSAHRLMNRGIGRAAAMGAVFGLGGIALMPVLILTGAPLIASTQAMMVGLYMALIPMFVGYLLSGMGLPASPRAPQQRSPSLSQRSPPSWPWSLSGNGSPQWDGLGSQGSAHRSLSFRLHRRRRCAAANRGDKSGSLNQSV